jgi:hypothetical protein
VERAQRHPAALQVFWTRYPGICADEYLALAEQPARENRQGDQWQFRLSVTQHDVWREPELAHIEGTVIIHLLVAPTTIPPALALPHLQNFQIDVFWHLNRLVKKWEMSVVPVERQLQ